jgi:hypothetical protein
MVTFREYLTVGMSVDASMTRCMAIVDQNLVIRITVFSLCFTGSMLEVVL